MLPNLCILMRLLVSVLIYSALFRPRWAFLFDKVMLICRKVTRLGFDVRYSPKHVFTVSTLSVDPVLVPNTKGGKVIHLINSHNDLDEHQFTVFLCLSLGGERSR